MAKLMKTHLPIEKKENLKDQQKKWSTTTIEMVTFSKFYFPK
jgi:hypothetical protein